MRILLWHVHGSWTDAFVRGGHEYVLPRTAEGGPWGLGRGGRDWPANVRELHPSQIRRMDIDAVVLQRPAELRVAERLLGRRLGHDVAGVYLEHNTPRTNVPDARHPLAERDDVPLVHVTEFNRLFWDAGRAPTRVIEHGLPDPGHLYTGVQPRLAVVGNEPLRRARVLGTDLLPRFAEVAPLDLYGMGAERAGEQFGLGRELLAAHGDLPLSALHAELAQRRAYLHPVRWTSLGLSLIEAMLIGMPVLVLGVGQAVASIPAEAGAVSLSIDALVIAARRFIEDPELGRSRGAVARAVALERFALDRFLREWDETLHDAVAQTAARRRALAGSTTDTTRRSPL